MKFFRILLSIIILLTFIFVGDPTKYNCIGINIATIILGTAFIIYRTFIKKQKNSNQVIDVIVLMFCITPIIPLAFKTCNSIQETLIAIVKNIALFNIYFMVKSILQDDSKNEKWIMNTLILGGIIIALFAIDEKLSQILYKYTNYIGILKLVDHENRMISIIGYPNVFASLIAIELMLCTKKIRTTSVIYSGLIYLFLTELLLSYSRAVIIIFAILFMVYMIFTKRKRIFVLYNFAQNLCLSVLSMKIFETLASNKQYLLAWISIVFFAIVSIIIAIIIAKNYKKICKTKGKTYLKIGIILVLLVLILYFVGKQLIVPLYIFENGNQQKEVRHTMYNIEKNKEYCFEFDIDSKTMDEDEQSPIYTILVSEENKYYDTINIHQIQLGNFNGKKEIKFTTSDETDSIVIYFKSNSVEKQNGFKVKSLYMNNKRIGLNYLYLPLKVVEKIESINLKHKSVWERITFYKDATKIIKNNFILGTGAKGWEYNYPDVQAYVYYSTEVHNFALQIFIEYGVIGFLLITIIVVYAMIKIIKRKKFNEIDIAFILLIAHSLFDFDMSVYILATLATILFAWIIKGENISSNNKILEKLKFILILINIVAICIGLATYKINDSNNKAIQAIETNVKEGKNNEAIELIKEFSEFKKNKDRILYQLYLINYDNVNEENLKYVYEIIKNENIVVNSVKNMNKLQTIYQIITTTQNNEIKEKLYNIAVEEREELISNIQDREKNRLTQNDINYYMKRQEIIYSLLTKRM